MNCWKDCPMVNAYAFCESAGRRLEEGAECPHHRLRRALARPPDTREGGRPDGQNNQENRK